jgi:hypothetical protein
VFGRHLRILPPSRGLFVSSVVTVSGGSIAP